ncbi:D-alanyl-D-alanine carboxypeptidase family protein [Microvirga flavescens]|uniref:D-alanyl-D-alanine carboxypeptidase family protein n=1 Tax=Microvirga flavescens TaxID=2249811 RepID=UPI000DDA68B7|nr:D-alanyl-D-alanine carboxypeptidase family protein [Microvirga flavescens]
MPFLQWLPGRRFHSASRGLWGIWTAIAAIVLPISVPAQTFQTTAPQAILVDAGTRSILFEKNADERLTPASMAKTMTAEIVFNEIKSGRLSLDKEFMVSENAWRKGGGPSGGPAMFAKVNSAVRLEDLLRGLIVQSGNDAAIAIAEGISGTEENFAKLMNERAKEIGLKSASFRNATGLSDPQQKVSARDLATLAQHVIETYPELYKMFGEQEFTWNKIRQRNRNPLLTMDIGADGLKSGNTEEAGYGLTGSAVQSGQRLIVVVNGLKTAQERSGEARKLLEWGFRSFESRAIFSDQDVIGDAKVFGGSQSSVPLVAMKPVRVLMPRGEAQRLSARIRYIGPLKPPVAKGTQVARLEIDRGDVRALEIPLYAAEDVGVGTIRQRAFDGLVEFSTGWARRAASNALSSLSSRIR